MRLIFIVLVVMWPMLFSCSFKGDTNQSQDSMISSLLDRDGDLLSDQEEVDLGRNPDISDLPELEVSFLQNYKVDIKYHGKDEEESKHFKIDTLVSHNNPNFKYRVGDIFVRDYSFNVAAGVGKYSSHSWGQIEENDLTWIKYPEVDPRFFHNVAIRSKKFFNEEKYDLDEIKISLENSVKLKANRFFTHIKDLELNFYYYDYKTERYELLKTAKIERHFNAGVNETFDVVLDEVPRRLIEENYLNRGEFIVTEIKDYEIPELKTTYSNLLASIRSKTTPIVFNTPLESKIFYVSTGSSGKSFASIMSVLFDKNFQVEENQLVKVGQFQNNLDDFTYLDEVKSFDKKGKWFVLTNGFGIHFLDYNYRPKDFISISFITGQDLSHQVDEKIYSYAADVVGGDSFKIVPLGNISPNSTVEFQVFPKRRFGTFAEQTQETINYKTHGCGKNCIKFGLYCKWEINRFIDYNEMFNTNKTLGGELDKITLLVNDDEYSLAELEEQKKISVSWIREGWDIRDSLHIKIDDVSSIHEIHSFEHNTLALKIASDVDYLFEGIKLVGVDRFWEERCPPYTLVKSVEYGVPVSNDSIHLDKIMEFLDYVKPHIKENAYFRDNQKIYKQIEVDVSSLITNFYN